MSRVEQDRIRILINSEDFNILKRAIASQADLHQAEAIRFGSKTDPRDHTPSMREELEKVRRCLITLEVLAEMARPEYSFSSSVLESSTTN